MSQVVQDEKRERLTRVVAAASLAASSVYIVWRWGWTLDPSALWFSLPLVLAETYGLLAAALLTWTAWALTAREPLAPLPGRSVDVFVTVADEPLATVRKTALAAREIRYPHTTWLLDDGQRDELRTVAEEIGIRYLRRADRADGKAGNLNHALAASTGEFILQLDADHVALPQIIDRLLGFFHDDRLAFVQSPQDFYNTDAFSGDSGGSSRQFWGDQQLFFNVLQPGRDRGNAAMFVGSCAMLRRAALVDVGGFARFTTTVGTETSLLMHAAGWRSAYLGENLAFGLAPATAHAYQVQQLHRAQGGMQLLRRYQPLALRGLSAFQRIEYLQTLATPLGSLQRLIVYLSPIVFLTTGAFPIRASVGVFAAFFLPAMLLRAVSYRLLARGQGSLLQTERYWMAKFFTHLIAVRAFLTPRRLSYRERPDETGAVPLRTVAPQLVLIAVTAVALAWAAYARSLGYGAEVPGWGLLALFAAVPLALWHAGLAAHVVQRSLAGRHRRAEYRFAESLSVALRVLRADNKLSSTDIAVTEDLTATGLALRCMFPIPDGARVELTLPLSSGEVRVRGHVVRQSTNETQFGTVHLAGIEFDATSRDTRDAIELHCAQHAMPIGQQRQRQGASLPRGLNGRARELRGERRVEVGMPARIVSGAGEGASDLGVGLLEDVSPRGGRVLLDQPVTEGTLLTLHIPGSTVRASGRVVFVQALETGLGMRFVAGFEADVEPTAGPEREAAPWYAAIMRLAARTGSTATSGTSAVAGALAKGGRTAATAATAVAVRSQDAVTRLASGSRDAVARAAAAARTARRLTGALTASPLTPSSPDDEDIERVSLEPMDPAARAERISAEILAAAAAEREGAAAREMAEREAALAAEAPAMEPVAIANPDDPDRAIEMEIDGDFSFPVELTVGATLLITQSGRVAADIAAVHAIVLGRYSGTLRATRSIRVGPSGRVDGVLSAPEVVIEDGAIVNQLTADINDSNATSSSEDVLAHDVPLRGSSSDDVEERALAPVADVSAVETDDASAASGCREAEPAAESSGSDEEIFLPSPTFGGGA